MATKAPASTAAVVEGEGVAPANETKADKFKRLGNARLAKALAAVANLRGLANKASYEYSPAQVEALGKALEAEVIKTVGAFSASADAKSADTLSIL